MRCETFEFSTVFIQKCMFLESMCGCGKFGNGIRWFTTCLDIVQQNGMGVKFAVCSPSCCSPKGWNGTSGQREQVLPIRSSGSCLLSSCAPLNRSERTGFWSQPWDKQHELHPSHWSSHTVHVFSGEVQPLYRSWCNTRWIWWYNSSKLTSWKIFFCTFFA